MYHRRCLTDAVVLDRDREFAACFIEDQANAKLSGEIARPDAGRFGRSGLIKFRKFVEWRKAEVPLDGLPRTDRIGRCRLLEQLALPCELDNRLHSVYRSFGDGVHGIVGLLDSPGVASLTPDRDPMELPRLPARLGIILVVRIVVLRNHRQLCEKPLYVGGRCRFCSGREEGRGRNKVSQLGRFAHR